MVQKGKFSAAAWLLVRTLKKVDFPTFGIPTMPIFKLVPTRPMSGFRSGSSGFFGAMLDIQDVALIPLLGLPEFHSPLFSGERWRTMWNECRARGVVYEA